MRYPSRTSPQSPLHSSLPHRPLRSTSLLATLSAIAVMVGTILLPQSAQAGRSWSSTIADQAEKALESLHEWQSTDAADDELAYELRRDRLATTIAGAVGVDADELRAEWDSADLINQEIILIATTQVGVPYSYLKSEEGVGFDCSGLLLYAYGSVGIDLPRVSYDQIKAGPQVSAEEFEPGDLAQYPGHIMMALGKGVMLHSRSTGYYVEVAPMPTRKTMRYADVTPEGAVSPNAILNDDSMSSATFDAPLSTAMIAALAGGGWG